MWQKIQHWQGHVFWDWICGTCVVIIKQPVPFTSVFITMLLSRHCTLCKLIDQLYGCHLIIIFIPENGIVRGHTHTERKPTISGVFFSDSNLERFFSFS